MVVAQTLVLLALLLQVGTEELPPGPHPFCASKSIPQQLPLTVNEILSVDLSSYFVGYNLQFYQTAPKPFAYIRPTFVLQQYVEVTTEEIISSKLPKHGNRFGSAYSLLVRNSTDTVLFFGHMRQSGTVPNLEDPVTIETSPTVNCFDSQLFYDHGIGIVDCINSSESSPSNLFYFVNMVNHSVTSRVPNQKYVNFSSSTKRVMVRFSNPQMGTNFLLRAYLREDSDTLNHDNTYVEIMNVDDLGDIQVVAVIDRTTLGLPKLSITDVKCYMGELIILDYNTGVYRLSLKNIIKPILVAHYKCRRFLKMDVYSDDLDEEFLMAIANPNAVHEIDWKEHQNPTVTTKYSLLSKTNLTSLCLGLNFLVVTGSSHGQSNNTEVVYNYTWIFSKESRSYTNCFHVISHSDPNTAVHFDPVSEQLLVTNRTHISNYNIHRPVLMLNQFDDASINTSQTLSLVARSTDPVDGSTDICSVNITVHFVERRNVSMWNTGIAVSEVMYSNYPGILSIPLQRYAFGPNITYTYMRPFSEKITAENWVHKQNKTTVHLDQQLKHHVNFLRTDVEARYGANNIIAYYQDTTYMTSLSICRNEFYSEDVFCSVYSQFQHSSKINAMATGNVRGAFGDIYVNIFNLEDSLNVIRIYEFGRTEHYAQITYPLGLEGRVTDMDLTNGVLYLTIPTLKRIDGYRLGDCDVTCPKSISITASQMSSLGASYFTPQFVTCTRMHPEVLFISNLDSVIVLDVDNHDHLNLLTELVTDATQAENFKIAVNQNYLLIVSPPLTIEEYKFEDLYRGRIVKHKNLELYNYRLSDSFDMEFNDVGDLFYITVVDIEAYSNCVLIFKSGQPLVSSLYDVVFLPGLSATRIEIEVSGTASVDFLTIIGANNLTMIKEYERPTMIIKDADESFGFYIQLSNSEESSNISLVKVVIANYPDNFNRSFRFPINSGKFLTTRIQDNYTWSDHNWFEGHVIGYNYSCFDCPDSIELVGHIENIRQSDVFAQDFYHSDEGGYIIWNDVIKLNLNGTIQKIFNIPREQDTANNSCQRIVSDNDLMVITACTNSLSTISIFVTTNAGYKPFTLGPWKTNSKFLTDFEIVRGLLMIVDVNPSPSIRYRNGAIFLYALDIDSIDDESNLEEIDCIDANDLAGAASWDPSKDVFVGNAFLSYNKYYRLYVSEVTEGIFVTTFDWRQGDLELNIKVVDYIDVPALLSESHFVMPSDATFQALTVIAREETPTMDIERVLVTTSNFHHFEIKIVFRKSDGRVGYKELSKVYYRYGYYNTYNMVRSYNGFVIIPYVIPPSQERLSNYTKQHIAIYDAREYLEDKVTPDGYVKKYIFASQPLNTRSQTFFNFNRTSTTNGTAGLVIVNPFNKTLVETRINRNLTIRVKDEGFFTQNMFLWAYSDFHRFMFELKILGLEDHSLKGWQVALIVIGALLLAAGVGVLGWWLYKKLKQRMKKTLLVEETPEDADEDSPQDQTRKTTKQIRINESLEMPEDMVLVDEDKDLEIQIKEQHEALNPHEHADRKLDEDSLRTEKPPLKAESQGSPLEQLSEPLL